MSNSNPFPASQPEPQGSDLHPVEGTDPELGAQGDRPAPTTIHPTLDREFASQHTPAAHVTRITLRQDLRSAFESCRQATLSLIDGLDTPLLCRQAHADFSPVGWHLGHIGYTEALWVLERLAGYPPQFPEYHRLFAADGLPKAERQHLPDIKTLLNYLHTVRGQVFDYLDNAPLEQQERLWWFLLQHESQHCETMALVLTLLQGDRPAQIHIPSLQPRDKSQASTLQRVSTSASRSAAAPPAAPMVCVPAGSFRMGDNSAMALDNERPAHRVHLDTFWMDRYPVTCQDFRLFMEAGGYREMQWWSPAGWQWLQENPVSQPLYWSDDPVWDDHPVCGVNAYEAAAYAAFVGKRLPTEAEWEKTARWHPTTGTSTPYPWGNDPPTTHHCNHHHWIGHTTPVTTYENLASPVGAVDLLGNVWEWTATCFDGYNGFRPYPYEGYSSAYFDGQHQVLRGGSWATRPWALRASFRNWYHPWVRQILAGFRCAADVAPPVAKTAQG